MGNSSTEQGTLRRNSFIGRERELAELVSACEAGADSDAHLFLIYGEPGIGKTRLADELASRVKARGMQVLWGRCWEGDGAPAYWPWIQVIRSFLGALDPERRRNLAVESEVAADIIHEVSQLIPDLRPASSTLPPSVTVKLEPSEARFRLFDAVTNFLKMGARARPMLIVLDDLHDADEASLAMLRFMARELKGASVMIVATYRDLEVRRSPSLSKLVGELSRDAHSIPMSGLKESEVAKLVEFRAGRTPDDKLVAKLCAATSGNPLFVDGIVRSLIAEGALDSASLDRPFKIPSGVREAIRGRLNRLSPESNSILAAASAIGNEFEFNLCQSVADVSADEAHRLLDEASSAGIVTALSSGRYRFSHALIREAVYEELDTNGRVKIHGKIANRLEEVYRGNIDSYLAELAHHFREAGLAEKAIDYSVRAGHAAMSVFAFTDAMMLWEAALELMEERGSDARRRANLLQGLSRISWEVDREKALRYGESAIALYESLGCFVEAATLHIHVGTILTVVGDPLVNRPLGNEHYRRAESVLAKEPESPSLAWVYGQIATNEALRMNVASSAQAGKRALEIASRLGDKTWLAESASCYAASFVLSGKLKEAFALFDQAFEAGMESDLFGPGVTWTAGGYTAQLKDWGGARVWYERELNRPRNERAP